MGCDIHSTAERKVGDGYEAVRDVAFNDGYREPFDWRSYGMFGFLADVRNYSDVPPLAARRGIPKPVSDKYAEELDTWAGDAHSHSWVLVSEMAGFDYDQPLEDRRVTRQIGPNAWSGGSTAEAGYGEMTTYREFLGPQFFEDLQKLIDAGAYRVCFFFDN